MMQRPIICKLPRPVIWIDLELTHKNYQIIHIYPGQADGICVFTTVSVTEIAS